MQVIFESRDTEGREYQALAEQRVRFVLRRLAWLVPQASIRLSDVNGPRGGIDKRCHVRITLTDAPEVLIEDADADLYVAIDRAADRAERTVARRLNRSCDQRHGSRTPSAIDGDSKAPSV